MNIKDPRRCHSTHALKVLHTMKTILLHVTKITSAHSITHDTDNKINKIHFSGHWIMKELVHRNCNNCALRVKQTGNVSHVPSKSSKHAPQHNGCWQVCHWKPVTLLGSQDGLSLMIKTDNNSSGWVDPSGLDRLSNNTSSLKLCTIDGWQMSIHNYKESKWWVFA